jgi:transketolase
MGASTRDAYGRALVELGAQRQDLVVLEADVGKSTRSQWFHEAYPERYIQVGVAEQNMIGVAAGLASVGFVPYTNTLSIFLSQRALNQLYTVIAYPRLHVVMVGTHCGLQPGGDGPTHQALNDLAILRSVPNLTILSPADATEARAATLAAYGLPGPVYLRLGRSAVPDVFDQALVFRVGEAAELCSGGDVALISTGSMTQQALQAAGLLAKQGIRARVLHLGTVKPLDEAAILKAAKTGLVVTLEEHSIIGGLGGAVAELLSDRAPVRVLRVGLMDTFAESGHTEQLFEKYGLGVTTIVQVVERGLKHSQVAHAG